MRDNENIYTHPRNAFLKRKLLVSILILAIIIVASAICMLVAGRFMSEGPLHQAVSNYSKYVQSTFEDLKVRTVDFWNTKVVVKTYDLTIDDIKNQPSDKDANIIDAIDNFNEVDDVLIVDTEPVEFEVFSEYESTPEIESTPIPQPSYLLLNTENVKTIYEVGDDLNLDNLIVSLVFDDKSVVELSAEDYTISEVDLSKVGEKVVDITFDEYQTCYYIKVEHKINDVDYERYTTDSLNLRSGPGTDFEKKMSVSINTKLNVIGEVHGSSWVKVKYDGNEYFCSNKYLSKNKTVIEEPAASTDNTSYGDFVKGEKGTSSDVVYAANKYWINNVPKWLRNKFENNGWKIVVSATPLNKRYGYSVSIAGITDYSAKTIYLDNRHNAIKRVVLHELGHFIDMIEGFPSQSGEFTDAFNEEKHKFKDADGVGDGHHTSNTREYFAEVFSEIIQRGKNGIGDIPKTYEFVSKYIG